MKKTEFPEAKIRGHVRELLKHNIAAQAIAAGMGMGPSTFSRWWKRESDRRLRSQEIYWLRDYIHTLERDFAEMARSIDLDLAGQDSPGREERPPSSEDHRVRQAGTD